MKTYHHNEVFTFLGEIEGLDDGIHIDGHGHKFYIQGGTLHRDNGPAVKYSDGNVAWWLYGRYHIDINAWAETLGIRDTEEFTILKLKYGK